VLQGVGKVARAVVVEELPVSAAVMVPAAKLPEASRETIRLAVFVVVAPCAEVPVRLACVVSSDARETVEPATFNTPAVRSIELSLMVQTGSTPDERL
jgi:hypothetical protein